MIEVTKEQFYARMGPLNVSPNLDNPEVTVWELSDRTKVGETRPGWKLSGDPRHPKRYYLTPE